MDRNELKRKIRNSEPTPGIDDQLVWDVLAECIREDTGHAPRLVDLTESRRHDTKGDGMTHEDARTRMLEALLGPQGTPLQESRSEPRSDLKDASLYVDQRDRASVDQAIAEAAARVRADHGAAAVRARALDHDQRSGARGTIARPAARLTLQEELKEAAAMPAHVHAIVAGLLPTDATRRP